ncbi:MAG: hypothetical protein Q4G70_02265 [Pseudomonadota bacterium]|nr:hypothetical protein [Pseudomonadota bacterium]
MSKVYKFAISLRLRAPFLTAASEPGRLGLDSPLLRDHRTRVCFPDSLIRGKLRQSCTDWPHQFCTLRPLLGRSDDVPRALLVSDFVVTEPVPNSPRGAITRAAHEPDGSGAIKAGAMQVLEQPWLPGTVVKFEGAAHAILKDDDVAKQLERELCQALLLVGSFGAEASVGWGASAAGSKAEPCPVEVNMSRLIAKPIGLPPEKALAVTLVLDRPFLVTRPGPTPNRFDSLGFLPGNVIKGALATTWAQWFGQPPGDWFSQMRITSALPGNDGIRPRAIPHSLVASKQVAYDVALVDGACLIHGEAPEFSIDWKISPEPPSLAERQGVARSLDEYFHWSRPGQTLRVRTAIEQDTRTAKDEHLFAYQMALHESKRPDSPPADEDKPDSRQPSEDWQALHFHTTIQLPSDLPPDIKRNLESLLGTGILHVGKTRAIAQVHDIQPLKWPDMPWQPGRDVVLVLQSDALLDSPGDEPPADRQALLAAHARFFSDLSGGCLKLVRQFVRQRLVVGGRLHRRYGSQARNQIGTYQAWTLTEAGSVFVLRAVEERQEQKVRDVLSRWMAHGLGTPSFFPNELRNWEFNPYVSENGFGEVRINDPEHRSWRPPEESTIVCSIEAEKTP